jgi:hypothetical protein
MFKQISFTLKVFSVILSSLFIACSGGGGGGGGNGTGPGSCTNDCTVSFIIQDGFNFITPPVNYFQLGDIFHFPQLGSNASCQELDHWQGNDGISYQPGEEYVVLSTDIEFTAVYKPGQSITEISLPSQFNNIRYDLGKCYKLTADIDLTSYTGGAGGWQPIGTNHLSPFTGLLNGNGHKIYNLEINRSDEYVGLFGYLSEAKIFDLTIELAIDGIEGKNYVGTVAGYATGNSLDNTVLSHITVLNSEITSTVNTPSITYVGGLVGAAQYTVFNYVSNDAVVTADTTGPAMAGGLAGSATTVLVKNSTNTANVFALSFKDALAGGLFGETSNFDFSTTTIEKSHNDGDITAGTNSSSTGWSFDTAAGGIVGKMYNPSFSTSEIQDSYNTGDIEASALGNEIIQVYAGGIAGKADDIDRLMWIEDDGYTNFTNVFNKGNIIVNSNINPAVTNRLNAGGITGHIVAGNITNAYNNGDISASLETAFMTQSSYGIYLFIGGIVGEAAGAGSLIENYSLVIENTYNTGEIDTTLTNIGEARIGGIVGYSHDDGVYITNNVSLADVKLNNANPYPEGEGYVSGILGSDDYLTEFWWINLNLTDSTFLENNLALDASILTSLGAGTTYFGTGDYAGTLKNLSYLQTQSTYQNLGWKFGNNADNPWKMTGSATGFPVLYYE